MVKIIWTVLLCLVLGCGSGLPPFNPVVPRPAFTHRMTVNVIRLPGGMGDDALRLRLAKAQEVFRPVGIELFFRPTQNWSNPVGVTDRAQADTLHAITAHEDYTLWVVDRLVIDGNPYGGWAWIGGRTAIVATNSCPSVIAHELGHCLGLDHVNKVWNLMAGNGLCETVLTEEQAAQMRRGVR